MTATILPCRAIVTRKIEKFSNIKNHLGLLTLELCLTLLHFHIFVLREMSYFHFIVHFERGEQSVLLEKKESIR